MAENDVEVRETVNASKEKRGRDEALALARQVDRIIAAKGKKTVTFDLKRDAPDEETLLAHLLGPTGSLRAPVVRKGRTLYIGFSQEAYQSLAKSRQSG